MSESVDVAVPVEQSAAAAEDQKELTTPAEAAVEVDTPTVETPPVEAVAEPEAVEPEVFSATEFARIVDDFGADIAAQVVKLKGSYETALKLAYDSAQAENAMLRERVTELGKSANGQPVKVTEHPTTKTTLFKTNK